MKIAHAIPSIVPALRYGGTERALYWLMEQLFKDQHHTHLFAPEGSQNPFGTYSRLPTNNKEWLQELESHKIDIVHFHTLPDKQFPKNFPHIVSIHGNGRPNEKFPINSVFVSQNHAHRHNSNEFVYNGLNLENYPLVRNSERTYQALFLAKASWSVKNLNGAIDISKQAKHKLHVAGGKRPFTFKGLTAFHARFHGNVDDSQKRILLSQSDALLFPVLWNEPFGIAMAEALASGIPVIGTRFGSLPEIVSAECGLLTNNKDEMIDYLQNEAYKIKPERCRNRVEQNFDIKQTSQKYLSYYKKILAGQTINLQQPYTLPNSNVFALDQKN